MNNLFAKRIKDSKPNLVRLVVEMSCMSNNQEISYTVDESKIENIIKIARERGFKIRLQRQIHIDEPNYANPFEIYKYEDQIAPLTRQLDDLYKTLNALQFFSSIPEFTPTEALIFHIEQVYFDCMSGGMGKTEAEICSILIDDPRIDKTVKFYDGSTLQDFADKFRPKEISNTIKLLNM